jgi:hypothetical protein
MWLEWIVEKRGSVMFHHIFYPIVTLMFLYTPLVQGTDINRPLPADPAVLDELRNILKAEGIEKGTFIKKITDSLKECTNGKMIELNYFTVKSSYWWDQNPGSYKSKQFSQNKELIIDRKFRSSIYDREFPSEIPFTSFANKFDLKTSNFVNSWLSVKEKERFFNDREIPPNTIPDILKNIMGYGVPYDKDLDTYPSVFQRIRALKTLKYSDPGYTEKPKCSVVSRTIANEHPSDVIFKGINKIFDNRNYSRFIQQNHPLSKIVQNHLQKLDYKSKNKHFKPKITGDEYNNAILYDKIIKQMEKIVELMSVFDIDMDKGRCDIPDSKKWETEESPKDAYILYAQLYEVFNDLLFLLMSVDNHYTWHDFDKFLTNTYASRFPVFGSLSKNKNIIMKSYPMRSGMDAFVNASIAIGHAPQDIAIAPKVANLENTMYYEIDLLLQKYRNRGETRSFVFLSAKPDREQKVALDDAILRAYVDRQVGKGVDYGREIEFGAYIKKLIDSFNKGEFFSVPHQINGIPEQMDTYENQVSQCKKIITEIRKKLSKSYDITGELAQILDESMNKLDQLYQEKRGTSDSLIEILGTVKNQLYSVLRHKFTSEFDPVLTYKKELIFIEFKKSLTNKNLFPLQKIGEEYCFEFPLFMAKKNNLLLNFKDSAPDLIDNTFTVDKHHSMAAGMTTDTIDPSGDPKFIENLYHKINQIRQVKQALNPSEEPFIILWDTTMEIDQGPCYALMERFHTEIRAGKVIFVLFRSLQKYANLGVGKSKAGAVSLIGKNIPAVNRIDEKLTHYGEDVFANAQDYALTTFFYEQPLTQDNEKLYYRAVRKHAQKLQTLYTYAQPNSDNRVPYMISGGCLFFMGDCYAGGRFYADTFGFAIPTVSGIENGPCRLSVGLDPKGLK